MRLTTIVLALVAVFALTTTAGAVVTSTTLHGAEKDSLNGFIQVGDALSGLIPTELLGDNGWHPANTNPAQQLPIFTDDMGGSGLDGLLNDFPPSGLPTKIIQYDFAQPTLIPALQILTGNEGKDGRVFSTTAISASTDGGTSFSPVGYFESDPLGTSNGGRWASTLVRIFDDSGAPLVTGATNLIFEFYGVDNTLDEYRDPFDGVNPFTNLDDGLTVPNMSPLVWEIDVVPEPSTGLLLLTALTGSLLRRNRRA